MSAATLLRALASQLSKALRERGVPDVMVDAWLDTISMQAIVPSEMDESASEVAARLLQSLSAARLLDRVYGNV